MIVKMQGASVPPARISKNSVSPSSDETLAFVPVYNNQIAVANCSGTPHALKIFNLYVCYQKLF